MSGLHLRQIVLERYQVECLVGHGAMGKVYLARQLTLPRQVAIKVLAGTTADPASRQRFEREAKLLASCAHQNIVRVLDFGSAPDGSPCLVMELLSGQTVEQLLERRGPLPWREALQIVLQLLAGVDALHELGILHRDLKTANMMIVRQAPLQMKLIDLGIARGQAELGAHLTMRGMTVGTPAYMAPELLRGEQATVASELYAVGLILYELLEGQLPFGSRTYHEVMRRLDEPAPRPTRSPQLPEGLWRYLSRCLLAQDPAARPESAWLAWAGLKGFLREREPHRTPPALVM